MNENCFRLHENLPAPVLTLPAPPCQMEPEPAST